ncbi:pentatricopeptide repeat-containing protein [Striga asiatica]|uniref:Pentatricopeptide repeat-containing protein n=1 Tax=Striga asiatica TaxID=4170 RepID=A0A5A7RK63_STRAF|nr:pentatricopeptide repeat-containing protein [Striga asiatica]
MLKQQLQSLELLLQLLQRLCKLPKQVKQIHSLLITQVHILITDILINTLLYNTLIRTYLNLSSPHTSLILFVNMLRHRAPPNSHTFPSNRTHEFLVKCSMPNEATFVSVLSSCANMDDGFASKQGKQIHGYMIRSEKELSVNIGTAVIAFYGKMGCLNLPCARKKLVDLGLDLFRSMALDFYITPRMEHYGCVVDLLGRAGLLATMPFKADASVLGALLGACRVHGDICCFQAFMLEREYGTTRLPCGK